MLSHVPLWKVHTRGAGTHCTVLLLPVVAWTTHVAGSLALALGASVRLPQLLQQVIVFEREALLM